MRQCEFGSLNLKLFPIKAEGSTLPLNAAGSRARRPALLFPIELRAGRELLIAQPECGLLSTIRHVLLECTNSDRIFGVAEHCREQRIFFLKLAGQEITE